jgi:hypothetical protein
MLFDDKSGAWRLTRVGLQGAKASDQWRLSHLERLQWVRDVIEGNMRLRTPVTIQTRALNCAVGTGLFLASSTQSCPNTPSVDAWEVRVADHWHDQTAWIMTE